MIIEEELMAWHGEEEEEVASAASTRQTIPDPELRRLVVGILFDAWRISDRDGDADCNDDDNRRATHNV